MYRGFNITLGDDFNTQRNILQQQELYGIAKNQVKKKLEDFININGSLNGAEMQKSWFPQIEADVFISHSHKDFHKALNLATVLFNDFGIKSFIDSCIWSNANDLLQMINNKYSRNPDGRSFSIEKLNYSASHVHMMLSTALSMMIDKTECLFFLNTPNSVSTSGIVNQTESAWIYSEISMSQVLRKKNPSRLKAVNFSEGLGDDYNKSLKITHDLNLSHLKNLDLRLLLDWFTRNGNTKGVKSLDKLYELHPITKPPFTTYIR